MTFVDYDQVEEVGVELPVGIEIFIVVGQPLVEREIDFKSLVDLLLANDRHAVLEMFEIPTFGLVDQGITISKEEDAFPGTALPETVNDLKGGVGFTGAGRHDQQDAVLTPDDRFNSPVDGDLLVVTGGPTGAVEKIILRRDGFLLWRFDPLILLVALPKEFGRREVIKGVVLLDGGSQPGAVMVDKAVAVGAQCHRDIQNAGVVQRLLQTSADGMAVIFSFDDGNGDVGLVVEDEVGALAFAAGGLVPFDKNAAVGEKDLFPHLTGNVPAGTLQGGQDELRADIAF